MAMVSKRSLALGLAGLLLASFLVGCAGKEEEYKIEGPTADSNPSVGAPVGADGAMGADPNAAAGAGSAASGKPKKGETTQGLPTRDGR